MTDTYILPEKQSDLDFPENVENIKVIGVGGAGCNAIKHLIETYGSLKSVTFYVFNTDQRSFENHPCTNRILLGKKDLKGTGAGGKIEIGQAAVISSADEVKEAVSGADLVFITAGMGGGTGTLGASEVAKIVKDMNILTIGVVSTPIKLERRDTVAAIGLKELEAQVDSIIVFDNNKVLKHFPKISILNAFKEADKILSNAVVGITSIITENAEVNADFQDIKSVLQVGGKAIVSTAIVEGEEAKRDFKEVKEILIQNLINSPLLRENTINNAQSMLVYLHYSNTFNSSDTIELYEAIAEKTSDNESTVILSIKEDQDPNKTFFSVTLIATGIDGNVKSLEIPDRSQHVITQSSITPTQTVHTPPPIVQERVIQTSSSFQHVAQPQYVPPLNGHTQQPLQQPIQPNNYHYSSTDNNIGSSGTQFNNNSSSSSASRKEEVYDINELGDLDL